MPPISTWTYQQAVGYSLLFGAVGAAVLVGALYLWMRWLNRPQAPTAKPRSGSANEVPGPTVGPNARAAGIRLGDVVDCERCGGHHKRRLLLPLTNPPAGATHYTTCPDMDEPVFVLLIPATVEQLTRSGLVDRHGHPIIPLPPEEDSGMIDTEGHPIRKSSLHPNTHSGNHPGAAQAFRDAGFTSTPPNSKANFSSGGGTGRD